MADNYKRVECVVTGKEKLKMKKICGLKSYNVAEVALLHTPGKLLAPQVTHKFL